MNNNEAAPKRKSKKLIVAWILIVFTAAGLLGNFGTTKQPFRGLSFLINSIMQGEHLNSYYVALEYLIGPNLFTICGLILAFYELKKHKNLKAQKIINIGFLVIIATIILY
jgi:hypothetical protein